MELDSILDVAGLLTQGIIGLIFGIALVAVLIWSVYEVVSSVITDRRMS